MRCFELANRRIEEVTNQKDRRKMQEKGRGQTKIKDKGGRVFPCLAPRERMDEIRGKADAKAWAGGNVGVDQSVGVWVGGHTT